MRCTVTGAAGFIGSHLCEALLEQGHDVVGVDAFVPYYGRDVKERNLSMCRQQRRFVFEEIDLREDGLNGIVEETDAIFHLAAMPGLVRSWTDFELYESCNVYATYRLLDAAKRSGRGLKRFIYGSTSSVYGRYASGDESLPTRPISPYGVTKLAAEQLCRAYGDSHGLPVVVLRYFSVYGPRQRPDMGYHRFIQALLLGSPVVVCGDGKQVRGNTFISDCVRATIAALDSNPGETYNVGGGEAASVWEVIHKLETLTGRKADLAREPARPGDQRHTFADTSRLTSQLGWEPSVGLDEGLAQQVAWQERELCHRSQPAPESVIADGWMSASAR